MRFALLGPLVVVGDSGQQVPLAGPRLRVLLAALLLRADMPVPATLLAEAVWDGAPPAAAVDTLRSYVTRLRRALGPDGGALIQARAPGYLIRLDGAELDMVKFEAGCRDAAAALRSGSWSQASDVGTRALELWRGRPLLDVPSRLLHEEVLPRLEELRVQALEDRAEAEMHLRHYEQLVPQLRGLTRDYPLRERFHAQLMLALYRCGRQAEALECYRDARSVLVQELGIEPGPELRRLHERVLAGNAGLLASPRAELGDLPPGNRAVGPDLAALPAPRGEATPGTAPTKADGRLDDADARPEQQVGEARTDGAIGPPGRGSPRLVLQPGEPASVPRELPVGPAQFTGRVAELNTLTGLLDQQGAGGTVVVCAVGGIAGIGKTALAVHWAHRVADRFPDGQLYVNLRGFGPTSAPADPTEAIRAFLESLGADRERIPVSLDGQAALYRSLLADKRVLIVLDNAHDASQVRPLLPASPGCLVLVTSRTSLAGLAAVEGARLVNLDVLTTADARELLTRRLGPERAAAEPDAVGELAVLCGRLPLALAITGARAASRPVVSLAALAAELRDVGSRLDALSTGEASSDLRTVFSWSRQQLTPETARMFRLLGIHPGPDVTVQGAASLAGAPVRQARQELAELTRASLVTEHVPGRYSLHDLLHTYAAEQAHHTGSDIDRREAIGRMLDHYLHTAHAAAVLINPAQEAVDLASPRPGTAPEQPAGRRQALGWFEQEHQVLLAAVALAAGRGFDAHAWQLPWAMADFLQARGHWQQWAATQRTALAAAIRLGDPAAQALSGRLLANACITLGDHDQARGHFASSLTLYQQLGNRHGEAKIRQNLGMLAERQARYAEALRHAEQALCLYRAIGDKAAEAATLNNVGWCHGLLGDYRQARAFCREAVTLSAGTGHSRAEGYAWDSLGYAEHHLGNLAEAAACYRRALSLHRESGGRFDQADTLTHLGDARHAAGELTQASDAWQQALAILEDLEHPEAEQVRAKLASTNDHTSLNPFA
jgi:DNA-binding SARP family transcriptional activator/tetratricopeptide (TPR) repeat protein